MPSYATETREVSAQLINSNFVRKLDEGRTKEAAEESSAFIREKLRQEAAVRELIVPEGITEEEIDRDEHTDQPKKIIDKEPDSIADLLSRAYDAMAPGGVLYVLDMMTDATRAAPRFSALFAVNMALTTSNGWVFSDEELGKWLEEAGFVDISLRELPPPMPHWLVSARKGSE